jgi:16S rRNA (guanine966-N2)-methyltransferase
MKRPSPKTPNKEGVSELRIIGGSMRGRKLAYSGDMRTRPMKDRVREAVFNLISDSVKGTYAIDLFAGTGALGLEAISRGAVGATLIERHFPTAKLIAQNANTLEIKHLCKIETMNTFLWGKNLEIKIEQPWCIFCSPPYRLFTEQTDDMLTLLQTLWLAAPVKSILVIESDTTFPLEKLPPFGEWDSRNYPPAVVSLITKS